MWRRPKGSWSGRYGACEVCRNWMTGYVACCHLDICSIKCVADRDALSVQWTQRCSFLLRDGNEMNLLLEVIALSRELLRVAPVRLRPCCYFRSAVAMICLQKLDEAEELLHNGIVACREEGQPISGVSLTMTLDDVSPLRSAG
jgi:hypothetical protein